MDREPFKQPQAPRQHLPKTSLNQFEIHVGHGFSEFEASAVTQVLKVANDTLADDRFSWRYVSNTPGLLTGECGMILRAQPAFDNYELSDAMIVVGGKSAPKPAWLSRVRQMQRLRRPVVLLSTAATSFIRNTNLKDQPVTTHWPDGVGLLEEGRCVNLTNHLSEMSAGVITAAGLGSTEELMIGLLADQLDENKVTELANRLILPFVRKNHAEQPNTLAQNPALHDSRLKNAIQAMETSIDSPLQIADLAHSIGLSTRHLERVFKDAFDETPARFYKRLRTKRARAMIEETQMSIIEIAVATGFGTSSSLSEAIKKEYAMTASRMRARRQSQVLTYTQKAT